MTPHEFLAAHGAPPPPPWTEALTMERAIEKADRLARETGVIHYVVEGYDDHERTILEVVPDGGLEIEVVDLSGREGTARAYDDAFYVAYPPKDAPETTSGRPSGRSERKEEGQAD